MSESLFSEILRIAGRENLPEAAEAMVAARAGLELIRREIEQAILDRPGGVILTERIGPLSTVRDNLEHYRRIAARGARIVLLGEPDVVVPSSPEILIVPLGPEVFARDWFVLAEAAGSSVALLAGVIAVKAVDERFAKFNALLTFEDRLVRRASEEVGEALRAAGIPQPLLSVGAEWSGAPPLRSVLPGRLAGRISNLAVQLHRTTLVDPLTGLYNHRHFYESLVLEANRFNRQQRSFTLLFLDVIPMDPERGAVSGEEAVRALAEMLQQTLRRGVDVAFKLRGAEFGVILGGTRDREAAQAALRIQETFASRRFPGVDLKVRINEFATTRTVSSILEFARRRLQQEEP